jgi:hypothetical protein
MKLKWIKSVNFDKDDDFKNDLITFERPYKCTCLCLAR